MGRPRTQLGTYGKIWTSDDGAPYKARARFRDYTGHTVSVARFGQTKRAAREALQVALRDFQKAAEGSAITSETTVTALADAYLSRGHDDSGRPWSINTRDTYRYVIENQVKPALGGIRLGELRLAVINRALTGIVDRHGPGSAKTTKTVLSGMCRLAIAHEAMDANPVRDAVRIPRPRKQAVRALTPHEADDLCDRLRTDQRAVDLDLPDLVEWMLATGARIGECCAARSTVLDLGAGTWEINATLIRVLGVKRLRALERAEARTWEEDEELAALRTLTPGLHIQERPKTAAGWRRLALPPFAVAMAERRATELRLRGPQAVLFGAPRARARRDPSNTAGDLREVLDRLGCLACEGRGWHASVKHLRAKVPAIKIVTTDDGTETAWNEPCSAQPPYAWVHSHTLRKTVATRLDEAGLTARQIADQLGHAKPSMTQDVYMGRAVVSADAARVLER